MEKMGSTFYWHFVPFAVPLFVWCLGGIGGGRGPSPLCWGNALSESLSPWGQTVCNSAGWFLLRNQRESEGKMRRQSMGREWEDTIVGRIEKWQGTFAYHINHSISVIESSTSFQVGGCTYMSTWSRLGSNSGCGKPSFPWSKSHHVTIECSDL